MNADPHPWARELGTLYDHAWHRLIRGVHDRHSPARHPTLATVSSEGLPQARTVVLRKADRTNGRLEIHTNLFSPKVAELKATPVAALHVWDSGSRLQIRVQADAVIALGDDVAETWSRVPERSRTAYSRSSVPGSLIPEATAYEPTPDAAAFAVVHLDIRLMDLLHLGPQHRRAQFVRDGGWVGHWVTP
jgi:hypothetical protein